MRQTTLLTLLAAALLSIALFYLKYEVSDLETELQVINRSIVDEEESIHVLKAEWSHLNDIRRLRVLAGRYLDLKPTRPAQVAAPADLDAPPAKEPAR